MTNQSFKGKHAFKMLLSMIIVLIVIMSTFATTALADSASTRDITIVDGTNVITVTTTQTEAIKILRSAGITLESNDKLDITEFDENGVIKINKYNNINIDCDGEITQHQVYAPTVGAAIKEAGISIDKEDGLNYNLTDPVTEGMVIIIKKAIHVTIKDNGNTAKLSTIATTVQDLLVMSGIHLGENDYTKPALDKKVTKDMTVEVFRVEYKTETKEEKVKFKTKEIKDNTLAQGKTETIVKGENGKDNVTYEVKYVNGKAKDKKELSRTTITEPKTAEIKVGTKKVDVDITPNGVKSKNGIKVGDVINGKYTHYCACATCNGNSRGITTSGKRIRNGMANPYYIACNWLPLGSVIKTQGHYYTVVDRGGSGLSRKGRIDIFTPGGHRQCYKLGTGKCSIEIIRLGW